MPPWRSDRFGGLLEEALQRLAVLRAERDAGYRASAFSQLQQAVDSDDFAALDGVVQAARLHGLSGPLLQQAEERLERERSLAAAALAAARRPRLYEGRPLYPGDDDWVAFDRLHAAAVRAEEVSLPVDAEVWRLLERAG